MGRQFRAPRRAGGHVAFAQVLPFVGPDVASSSSTAIAIPNYGVTDVSTWAAGEYVLDAPDKGVVKYIVSNSTTNLARVIKLSTGASVSVQTNPVTTGASGNTQITFNGTADQVMCLLGINSTHWSVMFTNVAQASTGMAIAST